MIKIIDGRNKGTNQIIGNLQRPSHLDFFQESSVVIEIIQDIKTNGLPALMKYTKKFDQVDYKNLFDMLVSPEEIKKAYQDTPAELIRIIKRSKERIWNYHEKQKQNSWLTFEEEEGVILGQKIMPLERVGIYVPGGRAAYPSSVLMNAIPALIAGVPEIIMVSPPAKDGTLNPSTLVTADILGITKIYKMGGAQSIAALAFGVDGIPKVDKITGPGNIYVTLAKREVYGHVDIDMIAGPSEIVVLADKTAKPAFIAADLLSQAEHDPLATSILITNEATLIQGVQDELAQQAQALPKYNIIQESLRDYGALIIVDNLNEGMALANAIAPEHLELALDNPFDFLGKVKHAGSIFLGHYSPEPLGDYMAGPNHILPTGGSARFSSPLSVDDFLKKSSFISFSKEALGNLYKDVAEFARFEGLNAHARSVELRFAEDD